MAFGFGLGFWSWSSGAVRIRTTGEGQKPKAKGLPSLHQFDKSSEVMLSIVGAGSGFGMVLH
jgi:hypothetical protein